MIRPDLALIEQYARILQAAGSDVLELRVVAGKRIDAGYFQDPAAFAKAAARASTLASGVYVVLNPITAVLYARSAETVAMWMKHTASDHDVVRRCWLPIDFDATRPAGISSTDAEHDAALDLARRVRDELASEGWGEPILADSGNGAHLLYRVDLPTADEGLVQRVLEEMARRFSAPGIKVDTSVHNPARIWKVYGTIARKGSDLPERPHRLARIIDLPAVFRVSS